MKRQFMQINPAQDDQNAAQDQAPAHKWSPPAVQSDEAAPLPSTPPERKGLLSNTNWKQAGQPQAQHALPPTSAETIAQQDTVVQQVVSRPPTGPLLQRNSTTTPVGPHQPIRTQAGPFATPSGSLPPPGPSLSHLVEAPTRPHSFTSTPATPQASPFSGASAWQSAQAVGGMAVATSDVQTPPSPLKAGQKKKSRKKRRFPIWARVIVGILTVLMVAGGTGFWYYQTNFASSLEQITGQKATNFTNDPAKGGKTQIEPHNNVLSGKRVNILLLGSDNDAKFVDSILAQINIIITIDPEKHYVGMLSIPRDMQVEVPNYNVREKLDEVFSRGYTSKQSTNPYADAAGLVMATIEYNYGIPVDYYAWVGLDGFIKVIDTAGGVDIDVLHPMVDDNYPDDINSPDHYAHMRLYMAPGPQHLDGVKALQYVRTRHSDLVGDFGRSVRQQQVLSQLKQKLTATEIVAKAPQMVKALEGHVKTSMTIQEITAMANYARNVDLNKVDRIVFSTPFSVAMDNSSNLAPICNLMIPEIERMFDLQGKANCIPQAGIGSSTGVASTTPPALNTAQLPPSESMGSTSPLQEINDMAQVSALSVQTGGYDFMGVRSLLDLIFMVTFESIDVVQP